MAQKIEDLLAVRSEWFTNRMKSFLNARPDNVPPRLWEAMCYSLEAGGKRIRPVLCQEGARLAGVKAVHGQRQPAPREADQSLGFR